MRLIQVAAIALGLVGSCSQLSCRRGTPVAEIHAPPATQSEETAANTRLPAPDAADWPWWRGPTHDGVAVGPAVADWTQSKNVVWKASVPGRGHASPTICGGQIFLRTASELYCIGSVPTRVSGE